MKKITIRTRSIRLLADTITPVSLYLKIRDIYPNSLLLESSDYHGHENSYSFICIKPVASFKADNQVITETYPDGTEVSTPTEGKRLFAGRFDAFINSFGLEDLNEGIPVNGLFGYSSYDAVKYFEDISLTAKKDEQRRIPDIFYAFYNYIIAIDHFQNILHIIENQIDGKSDEIERIRSLISSRNIAAYSFTLTGEERSNITDDQFKALVSVGKKHCFRGDVFQIVMSRQFFCSFRGDDFNVYRTLRSVNPSPYLFYFDYGSFRIFGSSPEAHLKINKSKAYINPIAGTFRRTGDDVSDKRLARKLTTDRKENAEHVMLVDLARNDLSRHSGNVKVESFREVQFYSHVIHLVSSVSGVLNEGSTITDMMTSTFPAGTLTGAPKYRAMQLIDKYEGFSRGFYGGAIGFIDPRGQFNHAIMIRTFMSKGNTLYYQAGAGIVAESDEEKELQEVGNKLGALREAIKNATEIN
ncbi:MAG: anthranilate synthase component I family protein [Bacteroidales bacterium]